MKGLSRSLVVRGAAGVVLSGLLPGCNFKENKTAAEREVVTFHRQLDAGNFAAIYAASHAALKSATTEADFVTLLEAVHRKLGSVSGTTAKNWNVNSHNGTTDVRVVYDTAFVSGPATETFVYRIDGGRALLLNYNINSMTLITK